MSKRSLLEHIKILTQRLDRNACDIPLNHPGESHEKWRQLLPDETPATRYSQRRRARGLNAPSQYGSVAITSTRHVLQSQVTTLTWQFCFHLKRIPQSLARQPNTAESSNNAYHQHSHHTSSSGGPFSAPLWLAGSAPRVVFTSWEGIEIAALLLLHSSPAKMLQFTASLQLVNRLGNRLTKAAICGKAAKAVPVKTAYPWILS